MFLISTVTGFLHALKASKIPPSTSLISRLSIVSYNLGWGCIHSGYISASFESFLVCLSIVSYISYKNHPAGRVFFIPPRKLNNKIRVSKTRNAKTPLIGFGPLTFANLILIRIYISYLAVLKFTIVKLRFVSCWDKTEGWILFRFGKARIWRYFLIWYSYRRARNLVKKKVRV